MDDLRLILLLIGAAVIGAIYLRGTSRKGRRHEEENDPELDVPPGHSLDDFDGPRVRRRDPSVDPALGPLEALADAGRAPSSPSTSPGRDAAGGAATRPPTDRLGAPVAGAPRGDASERADATIDVDDLDAITGSKVDHGAPESTGPSALEAVPAPEPVPEPVSRREPAPEPERAPERAEQAAQELPEPLAADLGQPLRIPASMPEPEPLPEPETESLPGPESVPERAPRLPEAVRRAADPDIGSLDALETAGESTPEQLDLAGLGEQQAARSEPRLEGEDGAEPELVIVLTVMARAGRQLEGPAIRAALDAVGLAHGDMHIYHRHAVGREPGAPPVFSVANVRNPGALDPAEFEELLTPGLALFMQVPGPVEPASAFQQMLDAGRRVAERLDAVLCDETRSTLTPQSTNHIRERIAEHARRRLIAARR